MPDYIPKKLKLFIKEEEERTGVWDGYSHNNNKIFMVSPTFVCDLEAGKTHMTALKWVKANYYNKSEPKYTIETRDNTPISGYSIVTIEYRGNGGRAYKVSSPDGILVDLREDALLECMLNAGISKGGVLNGEFVFAKQNAEMKLIRVGSEKYNEIVNNKAKIKDNAIYDVKSGEIYKTKKNDKILIMLPFQNILHIISRNSYSYNSSRQAVYFKAPAFDNKGKQMLYFKLTDENNAVQEVENAIKNKEFDKFKFTTGSKCAELLSTVSFRADLMTDFAKAAESKINELLSSAKTKEEKFDIYVKYFGFRLLTNEYSNNLYSESVYKFVREYKL